MGNFQTGSILEKCGIKNTFPLSKHRWQTAKLRFLGNQDYVLATASVKMKLYANPGGLTIEVERPMEIAANKLLGLKCRESTLVDVEVILGATKLCMAELFPESYPKRLVRGHTVQIL